MDPYIQTATQVLAMPKSVNINGKSVSPGVLFSSSMAESATFWLAASLSKKLHGEILLNTKVVVDKSKISFARLDSYEENIEISQDKAPGMGLAASLAVMMEAVDQIISPARKHKDFDFAPFIFGFRHAVNKHYDDGAELKADDFNLDTVIYDTITKPLMAAAYHPPGNKSAGIKR